MLYALGQTLNLMTLGGLALSVGILVDQAIVTIENIERHLHIGKPLEEAILVGAGEIGVPAFVSTLCICIVFVPMFFLSGVGALPVRAAGRGGGVRDDRLLHPVAHAGADAGDAADARHARANRRASARASAAAASSTARFDRALRARAPRLHAALLGALLAKRARLRRSRSSPSALLSCVLYPVLGRDFFPTVDAGQIRLHLRAATGTRIEETARIADEVEAAIRELVPKDQLETMLDNLGVPNSGINLSYSNAGTIGTLDGEILLSLRKGHRPTEEYVTCCARELPKRFPGIEFFFQPADIVTQILNFGLPAAIDVQFTGSDMAEQRRARRRAGEEDPQIPGAVDVHVHQRLDAPGGQPADGPHAAAADGPVGAERRAERAGVALRQLADGAGVLAQPAERRGLPDRGADAAVQASTRSTRCSTCRWPARRRRGGDAAQTQLLGNLVEATPARAAGGRLALQHHAGDRRLRQRAGHRPGERRGARCETLVDEIRPKLPRGSQVMLRGQVETMQSSFIGLGVGLAMAIVLVYLLIVVNFQSWLDALHHHRRAAGGARRHRLDAVRHRHHAVRAGADRRDHDDGRRDRELHPAGLVRPAAPRRGRGARCSAALDAGATRIRPVLMTALAMIIGMIPMALGIGEGGEQNAPLGRAVIGGLVFATVSTLLFVPVVYAGVHDRLLRRRRAATAPRAARWRRICRRAEPMSEPTSRTRRRAAGRRRRRRRAAGRCAAARSSPRSCWCCSPSAPAAPCCRAWPTPRRSTTTVATQSVHYVKTTFAKARRQRPDAGPARHAAGLRSSRRSPRAPPAT